MPQLINEYSLSTRVKASLEQSLSQFFIAIFKNNIQFMHKSYMTLLMNVMLLY